MKALVVDWLGRGGIADCTAAWLIEANAPTTELFLVTRPGRFAPLEGVTVVESPSARSAGREHLGVVRCADRAIRDLKPEVVIVQNYVLPIAERRVATAARAVGARLVFVVHDHRLHSPLAGSASGLRRLIRMADDVVTHSKFVAAAVQRRGARPVATIPLPLPLRLLSEGGTSGPPFDVPRGRLALHFGVLKRRYKGSSLAKALAEGGVAGWGFAFVGVGAPRVAGAAVVSRFLSGEELLGSVRSAEAALLPYRMATQSGAVVLAQSQGLVPVASAVGGVPEQIEHGRTGLLLPPGSGVEVWRRELEGLDRDRSKAIGEAARTGVQTGHRAFTAWVRSLLGGPLEP